MLFSGGEYGSTRWQSRNHSSHKCVDVFSSKYLLNPGRTFKSRLKCANETPKIRNVNLCVPEYFLSIFLFIRLVTMIISRKIIINQYQRCSIGVVLFVGCLGCQWRFIFWKNNKSRDIQSADLCSVTCLHYCSLVNYAEVDIKGWETA